jgi:HK97 family phage portal protein
LLREIINHTLGKFGYQKAAESDNLWALATPALFGHRTRLTNQREQLKAYLDWVYATASVIAQECSTIDLRAYVNRTKKPSAKVMQQLIYHPRAAKALMQRDVDGKAGLEELDNHILLDLLDHPNPAMDADAFKEMAFLHLMLAGESFWGVIRNNLGKPAQLWPMMPYLMTHKPGKGADEFIKHWVYRVNGEDTIWDVEDVVHIKLTDPNDLYRGMSIVRAAARSIDTDTHSADWNRNFFINSARPDVVLETDKELSDKSYGRLKAQWEDAHQGTSNAHKMQILEKGLKVNKLSLTQKDMDFLEGRRFNRDSILAMFHTSRVMLGILDGDGRANMEAAEYNHAKRVIRPLESRMAATIQHTLAPQYDPKLVISFTDPVPDDKEFKLKEDKESVNVFQTINEVREKRGLPPLPGGDTLYQPMNLVPVSASKPEPTSDDTDDDDGLDDGKETKGAPTRSKKRSTPTTRSGKRSVTSSSMFS